MSKISLKILLLFVLVNFIYSWSAKIKVDEMRSINGNWKNCANEGGVCNCKNWVGYGPDSSGKYKMGWPIRGKINCSNDAFNGDPASGSNKNCKCNSVASEARPPHYPDDGDN